MITTNQSATAKIMVTKFNLIFSIAAAFRILQKKIYEVRVLPFVVLVRGLLENGQKFCRFVSKKDFFNHFADRRKAESLDINVIADPTYSNVYRAYGNQENSKVYHLTKSLTEIACNCEDYKNQIKFIKRGICKHGYALLGICGYTDYKKWIERDTTIERVPVIQEDSGLGWVTNKRSSGEPRRKGRSVD